MKQMLFLYDSDHDGFLGFNCAIDLPKEKTGTYQEAIEFLMPILGGVEFIKQIIEGDFLNEKFNDKPFKCVYCGYRNYHLEYEFECEDGKTIIVAKTIDFINVW